MTSLAAGAYSGMVKDARIVTAQLQVLLPGVTSQTCVSRAFFLLLQIYKHVITNDAQGNAVVSMSFGLCQLPLAT